MKQVDIDINQLVPGKTYTFHLKRYEEEGHIIGDDTECKSEDKTYEGTFSTYSSCDGIPKRTIHLSEFTENGFPKNGRLSLGVDLVERVTKFGYVNSIVDDLVIGERYSFHLKRYDDDGNIISDNRGFADIETTIYEGTFTRYSSCNGVPKQTIHLSEFTENSIPRYGGELSLGIHKIASVTKIENDTKTESVCNVEPVVKVRENKLIKVFNYFWNKINKNKK